MLILFALSMLMLMIVGIVLMGAVAWAALYAMTRVFARPDVNDRGGRVRVDGENWYSDDPGWVIGDR